MPWISSVGSERLGKVAQSCNQYASAVCRSKEPRLDVSVVWSWEPKHPKNPKLFGKSYVILVHMFFLFKKWGLIEFYMFLLNYFHDLFETWIHFLGSTSFPGNPVFARTARTTSLRPCKQQEWLWRWEINEMSFFWVETTKGKGHIPAYTMGILWLGWYFETL